MLRWSLIAITCWSGCAWGYSLSTTTRPLVDPHRPVAEVGTVCVARSQFYALAVTVLVSDNHRFVGASRGMEVYFCYYAQPGIHELTTRRARGTELFFRRRALRRIRVTAGRIHYVRLSLGLFRDSLTPLRQDRGRRLIPALRYQATRRTDRAARPVWRQPVPALGRPPIPVSGPGHYATGASPTPPAPPPQPEPPAQPEAPTP